MSQVRVILRTDVGKLGEAGELVSVKPGYARNFLVPQGHATLATASNVKELEHHRRAIAEKTEKLVKELKAEKKITNSEITLRENRIRSAIGDNSYGTFPDGSGFSLKTTVRNEYVSKATTFRTLRAQKAKS